MNASGLGLFGLLAFLIAARGLAAPPSDVWRFVVSGDSRNCGDVVMPSIAAGAKEAGAAFYWHLGDFRAIYDFDQDLAAQWAAQSPPRPLTIADYQKGAWQDFLDNQLAAFAPLPVYLAIGNHELVAPKTRADYLAQFADWLNAPGIARQRLGDDSKDHRIKTYYHWAEKGVDFVTLDNATPDQFDADQVQWLEAVLKRDASDPAVRSVVVGMHEALPESAASSHSMNGSPQGTESGRRVYADLLALRATGKPVSILASHSHFYMTDVFDTPYWRSHGGVLPGWIVGTAGAVRYPLPADAGRVGQARTNVYGYLVATVSADGAIRFEFREVGESDVPPEVVRRFTPRLVHECFTGNTTSR